MQAQKVQQTVLANEKECFSVNRHVFVLFSFMKHNVLCAKNPPIHIHDVPHWTRGQNFSQVFIYNINFVYVSSEGSGESVHLRRYVHATVARQYNMYQVDSSYDTGVVYITTPTSSITGTLDFQITFMQYIPRIFLCSQGPKFGPNPNGI